MLSNEGIRTLQVIYQLMQALEKSSADGRFPENQLASLIALLKACELHPETKVSRLAEIADHLHPQMSLRHFLNFMIPLERLLQKNLADDQFLITDRDSAPTELPRSSLFFILDNLRSAFNVGSIFRLADCLNIQEIYLCGYTPTPENEAVQKTALGSAAFVPWRQFAHLTAAISELRQKNIPIIALETAERAESLFTIKWPEQCALLVGNERFGLGRDVLTVCDQVVQIPTFGAKNSLNVANALSICSYDWKKHWK